MQIYIIDDEPISLFFSEKKLRLEGVTPTIRTFCRAEAALQFLLAHLPGEVPAVILLDLNMPMMNGWDFLDALSPNAPVLAGRCRIYVLTSSLVMADTARAASYALVSGIIHKPLDGHEIRSIWQAATPAAAA